MNARRWVFAIWLCFVARGFFFCAALPLWEGLDEWSHFGVVQRMVFRGEALVDRDSPLPRDTTESLKLVPLPWELRNYAAPSLPHDDFWRLSPEERARREEAFRAIRPEWAREDGAPHRTYEGLQGPLSGWVMAPVLFAARRAHLATQVLLLRWFAVLIASVVIPLSFLTCRRVFGETPIALGCAAVIAAMPGLLVDVAHVSNEAVAVALFTAAIWVSVEVAEAGLTRGRALELGALLGLGLIAKAYFLTALPPVGALVLWRARRDRRAWLVPAVAALVAGWWYVRNQLVTGAVTGMYESARLGHSSLADQLRQIPKIHWGVVADSILFSHLWMGSWSTLTVRSWMYHLLYLLIALAAAGLALEARRRGSALRRHAAGWALLGGYCASFWLGQFYHVIPLFMVWGIATTLGPYLYAIITAEAALCAAGLRAIAGRYAVSFGVLVFAALDVYSMFFVSLPYYAGLTAHRPNGFLATFHLAGVRLGDVVARLHAFKPEWLCETALAGLAVGSVAATLALVGIGVWTQRGRSEVG
jgi:4-amino-4-deoxy-L-arabinose transferase-like glycosyltransferase